MWAPALSFVVDSVQVSSCVPRGERAFVKRRRRGTSWIVAAGNLYMRWSLARIRMFVSENAWIEHELQCFRSVHPEARAAREGTHALVLERLPGEALRVQLAQKRLDARAFEATGAELARCHELGAGTFAHGDPHLGNVLWDGVRARLIDFETAYLPEISLEVRRANDLLVLVLDLLGSCAQEQGLVGLDALLRGYDASPPVRAALRELLVPPSGLARVLWSSRTRRKPWSEVCERVSALRRSL